MAKEIKTEIVINAGPEKVWQVFTQFDNYPNWNPFIKFVKGEVKVGNTIAVRIEPPGSNGMLFKPKVLTFEANRRFSWIGHLLFKGLFDGEHTFELINNNDGTTTFVQGEKFNGILVPLFKKQLDNNTKQGFQEMNKKLKQVVEEIKF